VACASLVQMGPLEAVVDVRAHSKGLLRFGKAILSP
jgi:hypothetical protein